MHDYIGSDKHVNLCDCFREVRKNTSVKTTEGSTSKKIEYITPIGTTESTFSYDKESDS